MPLVFALLLSWALNNSTVATMGTNMKISAKSTMYSLERQRVLEEYGAYLQAAEGVPGGVLAEPLFCVASTATLSEAAKKALASSAAAMGYGAETRFFVVAGADPALSPTQFFRLVEGIDPLALVIADTVTQQLASAAYRTAEGPRMLQADAAQRILGRNAVVFSNFEDLLTTPAKKQQAWALLKKLPKLG